MILPKELLDQLSYYEVTTEEPFCSLSRYRSRFKLHFKQWWKPSKTILIEWIQSEDSHTESIDSVELRKQLHEYIESKN